MRGEREGRLVSLRPVVPIAAQAAMERVSRPLLVAHRARNDGERKTCQVLFLVKSQERCEREFP